MVEESIGVVVILVRLVVHAKPDILLPGVQEKMIEHVLHLVELVPEENIDLHVKHVVHVHHVVLAKRLQLSVVHQILFVKQKHTRVLVPVVLERQDLLDALVVHCAIVIFN